MPLPVSERDDLIRRVEQKLGRIRVHRDVVREAVDRTLGALPDAVVAPPAGTAIFAASSTPDLASRVRRALEERGIAVTGLGAATEGRHTVVTAQLASAAAAALLQEAAVAVGARASWRGGQ